MLTIYNFPGGARGARVAWLCEEMGVPYRIEPVEFPVPDSYRARNPLGQVPFLEDDKGAAITESVAMLLYIADAYGPTPLLPPASDARRARILQMTVFSEATIGTSINPLLLDRFGMPEGQKGGPLVNALRERADKSFAFLEQILGDNAYIAGSEFTLADIAVVPIFSMWCRPLGATLSARLAAYSDLATARPAYQRANAAR
jgi:glutathione S-transferase